METTEFLLQLSRQTEEKIEEVRALIERIRDLPIRTGKGCVHAELMASGIGGEESTDYGNGTAWSLCTRLIEQRNRMAELAGELRNETELLTSIADDVIGMSGRLI